FALGFGTGGEHISGSYSAVDSNNNPYGYGVDSFSAYLNADVVNGHIGAGCGRTDSTGMYGNAGQESWSFVEVWSGSASMAYRTTTNFAQMVDASYGFQLPGGHNIVVIDADYELGRGIDDGRGNSSWLYAEGTGSATLDCMSAEASGVWALEFGRGAGCYTDANFSATGSGHFAVTGEGNNGVTFNGLGISSGGGSLSIIADYVNGFSIGDYSLTAW
ncbi:unnamed protein product, partial [marine sediment metagenome]